MLYKHSQIHTHSRHARLKHTHTHADKQRPEKGTNTTSCLVLIYDPRLNRDKSGTLSQKMFDCILELPTSSQQLPHEKYISVLATKFTSPPPLHSPLPALTLDIFRSEQKLVAMATIINTSGIVIWQAHAHTGTLTHLPMYTYNRHPKYVHERH